VAVFRTRTALGIPQYLDMHTVAVKCPAHLVRLVSYLQEINVRAVKQLVALTAR
jgi:hypothetical protein